VIYFAIKWYGWVYGLFAMFLIWKSYTWFARTFLGLDHLSGMDAFWFHDGETNYANIVTFMRY
jgi:hypothetical protein